MSLNKKEKSLIVIAVLIVLIGVIYGLYYLLSSTSPTLEVIPKAEDGKAITVTDARYWSKLIDDSLKPYQDAPSTQKCRPTLENCAFDVNGIEPQCQSDAGYSYNVSTPCVFLKLKNIRNWTPDYYNDTNNLPSEMPNYLKEHINYSVRERRTPNVIWVSCEGKTEEEYKKIGPVTFSPNFGFARVNYPITQEGEFTNPLVAIRFERPEKNVEINVECRAWAKNLPSGSISANFKLFLSR